MLSQAIAAHPAFGIEERERDRPGPGDMVDTLEKPHRRAPEVQRFLLLGSNCLPD